MIALLALTLAAMQLELWFGDDRRPRLLQLQTEVAAQSERNQVLLERNQDLKAEIVNLQQSTEAAEERARSGLGLIRPNETFYQIAESD